jgi:O-antigen ligase
LLFTYSRGGLLGAAAALLVLATVLSSRERRQAFVPLLALSFLLATSAVLAATGDVFRLRLSTERPQSRYGAVYDPTETSLRLEPGETRRARVRVLNPGPTTWTASAGLSLSYHWYAPGRTRLVEGGRTPLHRDLAPGESVVMDAELRAPEQRGSYLLVWDMVQEPALWFSGQGVKPKAVPVAVGPATLADVSDLTVTMPEVGWHPSREELWGLAFDMWRRHPLTGVGSDNFRRLHGSWAGRPFWDSRVYANSLFLETASTTGTLGLLALVGTLVSAAFRSARCALRDPSGSGRAVHAALLLALIAETIVHGLVDYFLAFTGHYLLFGFLVGASAALLPGEDA